MAKYGSMDNKISKSGTGRWRPVRLVLIILASLLLSFSVYFMVSEMSDVEDVAESFTLVDTSNQDNVVPASQPKIVLDSGVVQPSIRVNGRVVFISLAVVLFAAAVLVAFYQDHILDMLFPPEPIPEPIHVVEPDVESSKRWVEWSSEALWVAGSSAVANLAIGLITLLYLSSINYWKVRPKMFVLFLLGCILLQQGLALLTLLSLLSLYNLLVKAHRDIWLFSTRNRISVHTRDRTIFVIRISMAIIMSLSIAAATISLPILALLSAFTHLSPRQLYMQMVKRLWTRSDPLKITTYNVSIPDFGGTGFEIGTGEGMGDGPFRPPPNRHRA